MTVGLDVGFPTQGELLRFLFKAAGVLPDRLTRSGPGDAKKKSLQKALGRLAAEEGKLEENFNGLVDELITCAVEYAEVPPIALAFHGVISDMLTVYREIFRGEGTYLSKRETVRWLLRDRWVPTAAGAIARHITRYGLRALAPYFPQTHDWYLPSDAAANQRWPLQKVMTWVYERADLSQMQFHYPGREASEADEERRRDLENAQSWRQGRSLPTAETLRWTFSRGLRPETSPGPTGFDKPLQAECALSALFLARLATTIGQSISESFGEETLTEVSEALQHQLGMALAETEPLEDEIAKVAAEYAVSPLDVGLRSDVLGFWAEALAARTHRAGEAVKSELAAGTLSVQRIDELIEQYGELAVTANMPSIRHHDVPEGFARLLHEGLGLGRDQSLTSDRIDVFEERVRAHALETTLPWLAPWLRFRVFYRTGDYAQAWTAITQAYDAAKYLAGINQYQIVNQYVELAVKAGDRVAFKQGVQWARFIGSKIRWIRDKELTQENLDFAWYVLKKAQYGV